VSFTPCIDLHAVLAFITSYLGIFVDQSHPAIISLYCIVQHELNNINNSSSNLCLQAELCKRGPAVVLGGIASQVEKASAGGVAQEATAAVAAAVMDTGGGSTKEVADVS
jgi:hypothetical protein